MTSPTDPTELVSTEKTVILPETMETGTDDVLLGSPSGTSDSVDDAYRRLGWIAALGVGVSVFTLAVLVAIHFLAGGRIAITRADMIWTSPRPAWPGWRPRPGRRGSWALVKSPGSRSGWCCSPRWSR